MLILNEVFLNLFSSYLENILAEDRKNHSKIHILIIDSNKNLKNFENLLPFNNQFKIFGQLLKVKIFKSSNNVDFIKFFERKIRVTKSSNEKYLVILSNKYELSYIEHIRARMNIIKFDLNKFLSQNYKITIFPELLEDEEIGWYMENSVLFSSYRNEKMPSSDSGIFNIDKFHFKEFKKYINQESEKFRINKIKRPLFICDMTFLEFDFLLNKLFEIYRKYKSSSVTEKRHYLRREANNMVGKIPYNYEGKIRNVSIPTRNTFIGNFLITFSQMKLFEDEVLIKNLQKLKNDDLTIYYSEIRELLLNKYKINDYIQVIHEANNESNIKTNSNYLDYIVTALYLKFHPSYPDLNKEAWRKQFNYIKKWLLEPKLQIMEKTNNSFKLNLIELDKEDDLSNSIGNFEISNEKIYSHIYEKETNSFYKKKNTEP